MSVSISSPPLMRNEVEDMIDSVALLIACGDTSLTTYELLLILTRSCGIIKEAGEFPTWANEYVTKLKLRKGIEL